MKRIQELFNKNKFDHHIYGIESHGLKHSDLNSYLDKDRFSYIFSKHYDSFLIEDARSIKSLCVEKTEMESIFIISFNYINSDAQNTLLKITEEPKKNTIFIFIFPNAKKLLKTFISRMEIIYINRVLSIDYRKINIDEFISMSLQERLDLSKKLNRKPKKDEIFEKMTKSDLQNFLDDLEIFYLKQEISESRNNILHIILDSRKYMNANGSSVKMILDNIIINM